MGGDNSSDAGVIAVPWVFAISGFRAGTRRHRNLQFLILFDEIFVMSVNRNDNIIRVSEFHSGVLQDMYL